MACAGWVPCESWSMSQMTDASCYGTMITGLSTFRGSSRQFPTTSSRSHHRRRKPLAATELAKRAHGKVERVGLLSREGGLNSTRLTLPSLFIVTRVPLSIHQIPPILLWAVRYRWRSCVISGLNYPRPLGTDNRNLPSPSDCLSFATERMCLSSTHVSCSEWTSRFSTPTSAPQYPPPLLPYFPRLSRRNLIRPLWTSRSRVEHPAFHSRQQRALPN